MYQANNARNKPQLPPQESIAPPIGDSGYVVDVEAQQVAR